MLNIPDDPIIRCIERTGYPPWYGRDDDEDEQEVSEGVFYGNATDSF